MSAEDRSGKVSTDEECTDVDTRERSFDAIARGVANGTVSRRKALRLFAVGLVGSALGFGPSVASAAPTAGVTKCQPLAHKCLTNIDCCSRFCDKNGNQCACTPEEIACQDPSSGQLRCVSRCASGLGPCKIDACNPATGQCVVANAPNITPCETGNLCTVDTCDNGVCKQGAVNVACGECFRCEPTTGLCVVDTAKVGQTCTDKDKCTKNSVCTAAGACVGEPVVCNDNNECTTDTCDPATGCVHTKLTGTPCETGNKCTADVCREGTCVQGPVNVTCPQCQACDPATGTCKAAFEGLPCEDGDVCTLGDTCQNGTCKSGPVKVCGQCLTCANVGGVATCVPDENQVGNPCNDNNKCTENEVCTQAGTCVGEPVVCNDNNECTTDTCDPETGCVHTKLTGTPCETGNKCTADTCDNGVCKQGLPAVTCPQCQVCDPATGTCKNVANGTSCEDGDVCTLGDTCQGGTCQAGPIKTCNQCQVCANVGGVATCVPDTSKNGRSCNDNNVCTTGETCQNGTCRGTAVTCSGSQVCCTTGSDCGRCRPAGQCRTGICNRT